ncbi:hypothetical protein BN2156_04479 [Mycolicibacterium neworleansense]|uniref:Uncharacterized protein n=1 Tax=Mycolicibacterium neworleansense TaxID=146018 RepID=A0A0H5RUI5_9MYCO|nr:hypothetical protein BN2156_04479 [Mycolicibacterium neworleansense]
MAENEQYKGPAQHPHIPWWRKLLHAWRARREALR